LIVFFWPALALVLAGIHLLRRRDEQRSHGQTAAVFLR
jgi:hypothetical protein